MKTLASRARRRCRACRTPRNCRSRANAPRAWRARCSDRGSRPWRRPAGGLDGRPAERRQRDREAVGLAASARRRAQRHQRVDSGSAASPVASAALGPVHRPDVERRAGLESLHAVRAPGRATVSGGTVRLEAHGLGRSVDARAMQVEVGRDALEGARPVEHRGAEPDRMGARALERHIALMPIALEEGPGFRPARPPWAASHSSRFGPDHRASRPDCP